MIGSNMNGRNIAILSPDEAFLSSKKERLPSSHDGGNLNCL